MKPDLTYYHNFSLPLKNFLYFLEKKTLANFPIQSSKKPKNITLKRFFYFRTGADQSQNFLYPHILEDDYKLRIKHKIKKFLIL